MHIGIPAGARVSLPLAGLIAAWDLTTGAASPIPNLVAAGTALTLPAPTNNPAITAQGLNFDGTDDYASSDEYPLSTAGTLLAAAHTTRAYPSDTVGEAWRGLIAKTSSGAAAGIAYSLDWYGSNATRWLRLLISDGVGLDTVAAAFDWQNVFHSVAGRWGGGTLSVWSDGVKLNEVAQTRNANAGLATPLKLGQVFGALANCWKDEIAFAAVYNRVLLDGEIAHAHRALRWLLAPVTL